MTPSSTIANYRNGSVPMYGVVLKDYRVAAW
jgi:hypothetical protein